MYKSLSIFILLLLLGSALHAQNKDVEGSEDHPMFTRVPGSTIIKYDFKEFDEAVLPLSKYLTLKRAFTKTKRAAAKPARGDGEKDQVTEVDVMLNPERSGQAVLEVSQERIGTL